jgi:hypothetical protein
VRGFRSDLFTLIHFKMKNMLFKCFCTALFFFSTAMSGGDGDPKNAKASGGKCTGSKYCSACTNCSRCKHCGAGGVCGVCSPESFEEKKKPTVKPKPAPAKKTSTAQKKPAGN